MTSVTCATLSVYGMPNEDKVCVSLDSPLNVSITGRAYQQWDRDAIIHKIVNATGNRGDIVAADAAGILQEMALSTVGVASIQVGCIGGAVSVAAFVANKEIEQMPVAFTAAVLLILEALLDSTANEVEPIVIVNLQCNTTPFVDISESFGLQTYIHGSTCIAYTRKNPTSYGAPFVFEQTNNSELPLSLNLIAMPLLKTPVVEDEKLPKYEEIVIAQTRESKPTKIKVLLFVLLTFGVFASWIIFYPMFVENTTTTTTTSTNSNYFGMRGIYHESKNDYETRQWNYYNDDYEAVLVKESLFFDQFL